MPKKIKCPLCSSGWCQNHVFQMNPLKANTYFKKKQKIRLCPKLNKAFNIFQSTLPLLNSDRKYYTPLFILEEQKRFYNQHDERAVRTHEKLIEKEQEDESHFTIYEPKHGRQKNHCSVCEKSYTDYLEHINSPQHKKVVQSNVFTRYIMQIQQNLKEKQPKQQVLKQQKISLEVLQTNQLLQSPIVQQVAKLEFNQKAQQLNNNSSKNVQQKEKKQRGAMELQIASQHEAELLVQTTGIKNESAMA